jgi:hypothetical protein
MDGLSQQTVPRDRIIYVVSEGQIIQSPTAMVGEVESEGNVSVPRILNHHLLLIKFQRGLC